MKLSEREREREMKEENGLDTGLLHQVITLVFSRSVRRKRRKNRNQRKEVKVKI